MKLVRRIVSAFVLAAAAFGTAEAQQAAPQPALAITVQNRTASAEAAQGAARKDSTVKPGDVLHYTLTFSNPTPRALGNVQLSNPLPKGLEFVPASVRASRADARLEFSADGGKTFAAEPTLEVVVDGKTVRRPAAPEQYTHVRWTVTGAVAAQAVVTAEYDARVGAGSRGSRGATTSPSSPRSGSR